MTLSVFALGSFYLRYAMNAILRLCNQRLASALIAAFFVSCAIRIVFADHAIQPAQYIAAPIIKEGTALKGLARPVPGNGDIPMSEELWRYLRKGLNYVEASGQEYPPEFLHPDGVAYGPLAITPIAVKDVAQHYADLSRYAFSDVLSDPALYEEFARCYADLLLRHYIGVAYWNMPAVDVFEILQKAWFLGPGLYKEGLGIPDSRELNAREFMLTNLPH